MSDHHIELAARRGLLNYPEWVDAATHWLRLFAMTNIDPGNAMVPFSVDEARAWFERINPRPEDVDGRIWGHITRAAINAKWIARVPGVFKASPSSHGSPKPTYVWGGH